MKKIAILLFATFLNAQALTFNIVGPCSSRPLYQTSVELDSQVSVSSLTQQILDAGKLPYNISENEDYLVSLLGHPKVNQMVLKNLDGSDLYFGWCYSVNSQVITTSILDTTVANDDQLTWFYGYIKKGSTADCRPIYTLSENPFCN